MPSTTLLTESKMNEIWRSQLGSSWMGSTYFLPITPHISKYISANGCNGALLDIGCSQGHITSIFDKFGFKVTGIDGDSRRIAKAKALYPQIDFSSFTFKDVLPFEDNSFDVVFSNSVFQYLPHDPIVRECRRVLKKGGSLILVENLRNNPITRTGRAYLKLTKYQYQSYPWNHFTLPELEKVTEELESSTVEVFHIFSPIAFIGFLHKLSPFLKKLDQKILKIRFLKKFAWLALLTGKSE